MLRSSGSVKRSVSLQERAFEEIYRRYWLKLFQVAWQKTGNREAAEELVQNLFVRIWERREKLILRVSLKSYLYGAIRCLIIRFLRDQLVSSRHLAAIQHALPESEEAVEDQLLFRELNSSVEASIKKLPGRSRTIFELSRTRHFSNKQIAGQLNISEKTVEYHLTKSLRLLRVHLKDFVTVFATLLLMGC